MEGSPRKIDLDIVDHDEFRRKMADPTVAVIDVLPPATFEHGHIPGARNLPLAHVIEHAHDVLPDENQEVVLYCANFT